MLSKIARQISRNSSTPLVRFSSVPYSRPSLMAVTCARHRRVWQTAMLLAPRLPVNSPRGGQGSDETGADKKAIVHAVIGACLCAAELNDSVLGQPVECLHYLPR